MSDTPNERSADMIFEEVRKGSREAFASWLRLVELPLRESLRTFKNQVDTEAVLQEGLLRMWALAPTLNLTGPDASIRYARRMVYNLSVSYVRKRSREVLVVPPDLPGIPARDPAPDMVLRKIMATCISLLSPRPKRAIMARITDDGVSRDCELAERTGMTLNTFVQNIVRARRMLRECLLSNGIKLEEYLS